MSSRAVAGLVGAVKEYSHMDRAPQGELSQVWTNLIDNAVGAMRGGGRLTVRTRCDEDQVVVEMTDDGSGIPEAAQCHLFEPFYTTKGVGEGTGLGLYLSKEIVTRRHGGSIGFESLPGATTFRVTLPRRPRWAATDLDGAPG